MLYGAFGYGSGFGYTLYYTTDFIFAGLAVSLAFHAGLFNIGPEGQAYIGGLGVILIGLALNGMHWALVFPLMIVVGALFGAGWAFIPGYLQAKRGSHIVITTILFNFIAVSVMSFLITRVLKPIGVNSDESAPLEAITRVPQLKTFIELFKNSPVNLTFFLAILALFAVYWLIWRTKFGYAVRALGYNPTAANYAGISNEKMIMIVMALSGALAAMVAVNNVGGVQGRLILNFVNGAGFVGIAVAFMGRGHPVGVGLSALLFGMLYQGGQELAFEMPGITREMIVTIQALVILFTGAMGDMLRAPLERLFARSDPAEGK
jgi:simple sugar transport system permease protein